MMKGRVSIIMPLFNAWPYVKEAVESLQVQSVDHWELWVVDDASSDNSVKYIEEAMKEDKRIHLLCNEKNSGAAFSRNRGIAASKGEYIAFLDSDDVWRFDKLEKQLSLLEESKADMVCSSYSIIDEDGESRCSDFLVPSIVNFSTMKRRNLIGCSTVLIRRSSLGEHRFRSEYYHEDYALWLELLKEGHSVAAIQDVLVNYRMRKGSRSFGKFRSAVEHWRILNDLLHLSLWDQIYCMCCYGLASLKKYFVGRRRSYGL